jgi:dihydrolipoamide dehydrogenase
LKAIKTELAVVGAGPGGYAAAFYAATKGKKVILVEREPRLGGVCLNRGCIPSKALLHATELIREARKSEERGITFGEPRIHLEKLRAWKESILDKLGQGIRAMAKSRGVEVMTGRGYFESSKELRVETGEGQRFVEFEHAIIAVGSKSAMPKAFDLGNPRVMTSREALEMEDVPERLLVVGGGYIGMELGTVYATLGSSVVVVEALDTILAGADADLVKPVMRAAEKLFSEIRLKVIVREMATSGKQIKVVMETGDDTGGELYDRVLVAVGRVPNCANLGLENTKAQTDEKGFIKTNPQRRTDDEAIYAVGDIAGGTLLAHKASREARIAVEALCGELSSTEELLVPAVIFTNPELAWVGLTEVEAKDQKLEVKIAKFPWSASGRALTFDRTDGLTKLIVDPATERILGVGIAGHGASELIAEGTHAIEMGATAFDLASTIHPHPTLSETLMESAETFYGTSINVAPGPGGRAPRRTAEVAK